MKMQTVRIIACVCFVALVLAGCSKQESGPGAMGSQVWEEMPKLTYGVLETDSLEVFSWNSGRCEATAKYRMAETENGYYYRQDNFLYYADKNNLDNWVVLCKRPDCEHWDMAARCDAYFPSNTLVIKNNRIFYEISSRIYPELYAGRGSGTMLVSMEADGSGKQLEYALEGVMSKDGGMGSFLLTAAHWLYLHSYLDNDGNRIIRLFRVTESGMQEIELDSVSEIFNDSNYIAYLTTSSGLNGDEVFYCNVLNENNGAYHRFVDDQLLDIDLAGLEQAGAYLSGNTLRCFRPNDGYYDIDLTTREECYVGPARLQDSIADIMLPNCIVESTLLWSKSGQNRTEGMVHKMELFDGKCWRAVKLPESLVMAKESQSLSIQTITSDSILFTCWNSANDGYSTPIYRIALDSEELVMEYCGEIVEPHDEEME